MSLRLLRYQSAMARTGCIFINKARQHNNKAVLVQTILFSVLIHRVHHVVKFTEFIAYYQLIRR